MLKLNRQYYKISLSGFLGRIYILFYFLLRETIETDRNWDKTAWRTFFEEVESSNLSSNIRIFNSSMRFSALFRKFILVYLGISLSERVNFIPLSGSSPFPLPLSPLPDNLLDCLTA
jgi:hypothetical protein